jgi:hypothetical protein
MLSGWFKVIKPFLEDPVEDHFKNQISVMPLK